MLNWIVWNRTVHVYKIIGFLARVFARTPGFNPWSSHAKDSKMVLDAALLRTQYYKVRVKVKVELHLYVVTIEMGAFG